VRGRLPLYWVGALGVLATVLTGLGEAGFFRLAYHADLSRVLQTNFSLMLGVRPAVVVFGITLTVTLAGLARALTIGQPKPKRRPAVVLGAQPGISDAGISDG
jgi:hypothetical protein